MFLDNGAATVIGSPVIDFAGIALSTLAGEFVAVDGASSPCKRTVGKGGARGGLVSLLSSSAFAHTHALYSRLPRVDRRALRRILRH